jgi:anaerobic ribonucleoside-triphosphate reductase
VQTTSGQDGQKDRKKRMPCEVYSRIVGYLRPVQNWNEGKQQEFKDRLTYGYEQSKRKAEEMG